MDSTIARFPYLLENLTLYSPDIVGIILGMILMLVFFFLCRYGLLYGYGMSIYLAEKRTIENKKHILGDLILMKDIQTELESEIEKGMLKSTFQ